MQKRLCFIFMTIRGVNCGPDGTRTPTTRQKIARSPPNSPVNGSALTAVVDTSLQSLMASVLLERLIPFCTAACCQSMCVHECVWGTGGRGRGVIRLAGRWQIAMESLYAR